MTKAKTKLASAQPPQDRYSNDDDRWQAVLRRDTRADGHFYYAVKTTGVYCRPSCSARRPRRENVEFHPSALVARQAGFRACQRCQPEGPALTEQHARLVEAACRTIQASHDMPSLELLAKDAGLSRFHFHRIFTATAGLTPKAYALAQRAERMRQELPRRHTVTEAIYRAGYNSNGRFYADSRPMLGMTAKQFQSGGAGTSIRFTIRRCSLGLILVAASATGICAIFLGDDRELLEQNLRDRFPQAQLAKGDAAFQQMVAAVVAFVQEPKRGLQLPLDIRGTAFQRRVWKALCEIPPGSTASYAQIAERIGSPKSARAVAQACAANAIAVAIPCHRVVRGNGELSGYRWGVSRKRALLHLELHHSTT